MQGHVHTVYTVHTDHSYSYCYIDSTAVNQLFNTLTVLALHLSAEQVSWTFTQQVSTTIKTFVDI